MLMTAFKKDLWVDQNWLLLPLSQGLASDNWKTVDWSFVTATL